MTGYLTYLGPSPPCKQTLGHFVTWLVMRGKMNRILCSDWLPERARWAHLARSGLPVLIPRKKKSSWSGLTKFVTFGQCR